MNLSSGLKGDQTRGMDDTVVWTQPAGSLESGDRYPDCALQSPGELLKILLLQHQPRPMTSESLGVGVR